MINRTSIKYLTTFIVCLFFLITSCESEHGIEPKPFENQEFGFGGNIVFYGVWPDSIKRMILIVFKDPPGFVITILRPSSICSTSKPRYLIQKFRKIPRRPKG